MKRKNTINVAPLNERDFASKYANRVRTGKTKKDHESGAHGARFSNRAARVAWQHANYNDREAAMRAFPGAR